MDEMLPPKDRLAEWIQKQDLYIGCLQETHFRTRDTNRLKVRGMEKDIPRKWKSKESWSSNSHIRKNRLKIKTITRDKEGHYIMIKGSIQEEDITIVKFMRPT